MERRKRVAAQQLLGLAALQVETTSRVAGRLTVEGQKTTFGNNGTVMSL
jgi:hypothetical protein